MYLGSLIFDEQHAKAINKAIPKYNSSREKKQKGLLFIEGWLLLSVLNLTVSCCGGELFTYI